MSSTATVPPYLFEAPGTHDAPFTFEVPASLEVQPYTAHATFDGTGASGDFRPCLTFYSADGVRLGRYFPANVVVAGDVQEVTYTPPFGTAAVSSSTGGFIPETEQLGGSATISVAVGNTDTFSIQHVSGASLLDLTVPKVPTYKQAGLYVNYAQLFVTTAPVPASARNARVVVGPGHGGPSGTWLIEGGTSGGPSGFQIGDVNRYAVGDQAYVGVSTDTATTTTYSLARYTIARIAE